MFGKQTGKAWPIRTGGSTGLVGHYGKTRDGGTKWHRGVDFLGDSEVRIYAAHDGIISRDGFERTNARVEVNEGYGCRIWLDGKDGLQTRYAHLCMQVYRQGMAVAAGDLIGWLGRTGNVSGAIPTHLHFEVRYNLTPVDPVAWLGGAGVADLEV